MFGSKKAKKADVLSHWYTLVDYFHVPCQEFYEGVEQELTTRNVPGLKISHVVFSEGGVLSAKRLYLRMKRERLVFDICAAPFGTSYFFSMRFAELPRGTSWWRWLPFLLGAYWIWEILQSPPGDNSLFLVIGFGMLVMVVLWLIISLIENHIRTESYYRQDTRLMYLEIVNAVVKQKIAEFTSSSGINLLDIRQHSPLMDDLYRTTRVNIEATVAPSAIPSEPVAA